ncbi:MAG: hypothetical protein AAGF01_04980 [Cyanobacteria bacterium P01_G01_bin.38]
MSQEFSGELEVVFLPQEAGGFVDVYHEGILIGCVKPLIAKKGWAAIPENSEFPVLDKTDGMTARLKIFNSRENAAASLIQTQSLRKMLTQEEYG